MGVGRAAALPIRVSGMGARGDRAVPFNAMASVGAHTQWKGVGSRLPSIPRALHAQDAPKLAQDQAWPFIA